MLIECSRKMIRVHPGHTPEIPIGTIATGRLGARACPAIAFCTITGGWLRYLTTLVIGSLLEGKGKISI